MDIYRFFDLLKLCHHVFVNMQTPGCIENHEIIVILRRMFHRCFRNIRRLCLISHGENFHSLFFTVDLQLFDRCRTIYVAGNEKRFLAFQLELSCQLRCCGRLTGSLQTAGYNLGDGSSKTIPVFGVDAIASAKQAIDEGKMTGTIMQDAAGMAETITTLVGNIKDGAALMDNTGDLNVDEGVAKIRVPYGVYTAE